MSVRDDIRWLQEADDRLKLFVQIAKKDHCQVKTLKELIGSDDWWPVKHHCKTLEERGLIEKTGEGTYRTTEDGEKVFESLRTVADIESV